MKLEKLEALRGLAAVYVVFHHSVPHDIVVSGLNIGVLFRFGQEAVILFFLLSGFVINYSFNHSKDRTFRAYFFKRFYRIYIPLFFVMFLGWVIECFRAGEVSDIDARSLLLNFLMLQDVGSLKPNVIVEPYMHNAPLWSLSYEWWFYMIYFPIQKYISSNKSRDILVFCMAIISALVYLYNPVFLPRLLMYMSIWWLGVVLSNSYISNAPMTVKELLFPLSSIALVSIINGVGVYLAIASHTYSSVGVHPALELRHHFFALIVVILALFWKSNGWALFDKLISPFVFFAPMSYVIYISHQYFVVSANYLSFLNNKVVELPIYMTVMLIFSYAMERKIYPSIQGYLINITSGSTRRRGAALR